MGSIFRLDGFGGDPSPLKQTILLKVAMIELGLNPNSFNIGIDHDKGISTINGIKVGIIYPEHFFAAAKKQYHDMQKKTQFYFNGFEGENPIYAERTVRLFFQMRVATLIKKEG